MTRGIKKLAFLALSAVTIFACATFMSACGKVGKVSSSTLLYDGNYVTWGEVKNAEGYVVTVNGKIYDAEDTKLRVPAKASDEEVEISVAAIGKKGKEGEATTRIFYRLDKMEKSSITFDEEGVMSWEEVEGADEYIISLNNEEFTVTDTEFEDFVYGKQNDIKIKPSISDGSSFSTWSDKISKMYLGSPTNIKYDGATLTWTGSNVSTCLGYSIYIDGNIYEELVTEKQYAYNAGESSFDVEIKAVGEDIVNGASYSSPLSEQKSFIYLPRLAQEDLEYDQDTATLNWPQIEHAKSYLVKLNHDSAPVSVTKNSISLSAGESHNVSIMAVADTGETFFSMYSEPKPMYILKAPQPTWSGATFEAGKNEMVVSWNAVTGATGYSVNLKKYKDGRLEKDETVSDGTVATRYFEYAFLEAGKYELTVQALTTNENAYPSALSTKFTITRLEAPTLPAQGYVKSNPNDLSAGFELNWNSVYGASGYNIYKDGSKIASTENVNETSKRIYDIVDENIETEEKIDYTIQSVGKVDGHTIFLPSINTTEHLRHVEITVNAKPSEMSFSGWNASWTGVAQNANGYSVKINGTYNSANNETYSLQTIETAGDHQIAVCTRGNGGTLLPSNYTENYLVQKLNAPKNLTIGTTENEGTLKWEGDDRCSSYSITIKSTEQNFRTSEIGYAIADLISKEGVAIGVTAIANTPSPDGTAYYLTSNESQVVEFKKLAAPTFGEVKVSGKKLIWNKPENAGAFQPNYRVYTGDGTLIPGLETSNEKELLSRDYPAGKYTFKVQAIGDGTHYINSDLTEKEAEIRILETPTITRTETGYAWKSVNYANGYVLMIEETAVDSKLFTYDAVKDMYEYTPTQFTAIQEYDISIYARGDGGRELVDSVAYEFVQLTDELDTPDISVGYNKARYEIDGKVQVTVLNEVPYATGYVFEVGNSASGKKTELLYEVKPSAPGELDINVYAVGGRFDDNGVYRLNSQISSHKEGNPKKITLLGRPSTENIQKDTYGNLAWSKIDGSGYDVEVTYRDEFDVEHTVTFELLSQNQNGLDKDKLEEKGVMPKRIVKVRVAAKGNGTTIISSAYGEREWQL